MTDAGYASGDLVHPLMFAPEFYKREFRSAVADMKNSVRNRANAQSSCAAQFIWWHIEDTKVKWCHVDLAGPAFPVDRGTGFGCALFDADLDGDLDLFVANTSEPAIAVYDKSFSTEDSKLYRNDDGFFQDVTEKFGLFCAFI